MKIQHYVFTENELAIDVDPGLYYTLVAKYWKTPQFSYKEDAEIPVIDADYFAPSNVTVRCENNQIIIDCKFTGYINSVLLYVEGNHFTGAIEQVIVDLRQAQNITIQAGDAAAYHLDGPFQSAYNMIQGTDEAHNYETTQNLKVLQCQFNGITYPCNGSGTQTGTSYSLQRFIPAYVDN